MWMDRARAKLLSLGVHLLWVVKRSIAAQSQVGAEEVEQVGAVLCEGVEPVGDVHTAE